MGIINVYHTTTAGVGNQIVEEGFRVSSTSTALYGRGVYFWEFEIDAHTYGSFNNIFPTGYEIVSTVLDVTEDNSVLYDIDVAFSDPQLSTLLAQYLMSEGKEIVVIPNPYIEDTTHTFANGRAFCLLSEPTD